MNVLVLKVNAGEATVIADNGEFITIPAKSGMKEGAEFEYTPQKKTWKRYAVAIAASLLLCVLGFGALGTFSPVGYIDININPGIRLAVNRWGNVISAEAINEDGSILLSEVSGLTGSPESSVKQIISQAWKDGALKSSGRILLTISDNDIQRAQKTEMKLMVSALEAVKGTGLSVDIILQKLDSETFKTLREEQEAMDDGEKSGAYDPSLRHSEKSDLYIEEATYSGKGVIEVEFSGEVSFTGNENITVEDLSGVLYSAQVKEAGGKKLLLQCGGLREDNIYKITVEKAGAEGVTLTSYLYINALVTENEGLNNLSYPDDKENGGDSSYEDDDAEAENPETGEDDDSGELDDGEPDEREDDDDEDTGGDSELEDDEEEDGPDTGNTDDDGEEDDEHEEEEEVDD